MRYDAPPQWSVSAAHLSGAGGDIKLSRSEARRLEALIAAGPERSSGAVNCPMDTGKSIDGQFSNRFFSYRRFTIKLDGCAGTPSHGTTDQLRQFLATHAHV